MSGENAPPVPSDTEAQPGGEGAAPVARARLVTANGGPAWSLELGAPGAEAARAAHSGPDLPRPAPSEDFVEFCDEGIAAPSRKLALLECLADPSSLVGEELRLLAAKVQDLRRARGLSCLAVTSPLPGEGKSTISVGLAGALAREAGRRILLVEADIRRPSLTAGLGLPPAAGLGEWLNRAIHYVPVRLVEPGGFFLMVAGRTEPERPELLGSARMAALLRAARGVFDFVILDAMPVLPVADAVLIQDLIDGFLLVVRSRHTRHDAIHDALAKLRRERIAGVVLNDHEEHKGSYRARAYERYGMAYGRRPGSSEGAGGVSET